MVDEVENEDAVFNSYHFQSNVLLGYLYISYVVYAFLKLLKFGPGLDIHFLNLNFGACFCIFSATISV